MGKRYDVSISSDVSHFTFRTCIKVFHLPIAQVTVTVDGGTNHWMEYLGDRANEVLSGQCKKYLPMLVTGDMDSILPDLLDKLKRLETNIIYTPDVMETDYTKALRQLRQYLMKNNIKVLFFTLLIDLKIFKP